MDEFTYHIVYKGGLAVKIMNILLICFVIIVGSSLVFNKKAMSQSIVDAGDIVILNVQEEKIILVYHKLSNSFLFYGYPSSGSNNNDLQLLQIRTLKQDFQMAEKLSHAGIELSSNEEGYSVENIVHRVDDLLSTQSRSKTKKVKGGGGHYPSPAIPLKE